MLNIVTSTPVPSNHATKCTQFILYTQHIHVLHNKCIIHAHVSYTQSTCSTYAAHTICITHIIYTKAHNTYETLSQHNTHTHYIKTRQTHNLTHTQFHIIHAPMHNRYTMYVCTVYIHSLKTHTPSYQYSSHLCLSYHTTCRYQTLNYYAHVLPTTHPI
jgi:hypothetical protein